MTQHIPSMKAKIRCGAMLPNKLIALSDKEWGSSLELGRKQALCDVLKLLAELKKKYTEK